MVRPSCGRIGPSWWIGTPPGTDLAAVVDPGDAAEMEEAERLNRRIVERALRMDGTCTGEHGVGMHKMDFLVDEHGADAVELMARIKRAFDPLNILNPGKVVRL